MMKERDLWWCGGDRKEDSMVWRFRGAVWPVMEKKGCGDEK